MFKIPPSANNYHTTTPGSRSIAFASGRVALVYHSTREASNKKNVKHAVMWYLKKKPTVSSLLYLFLLFIVIGIIVRTQRIKIKQNTIKNLKKCKDSRFKNTILSSWLLWILYIQVKVKILGLSNKRSVIPRAFVDFWVYFLMTNRSYDSWTF